MILLTLEMEKINSNHKDQIGMENNSNLVIQISSTDSCLSEMPVDKQYNR